MASTLTNNQFLCDFGGFLMDYEYIKAVAAIVAAVIAAITSIITLLISSAIKSIIDKDFHKYKLKSDFEYEEKKKIKEQLSLNKMKLLNAAETLNHRLWNFTDNVNERWHKVDGNYKVKANTYFVSFVYRLAAFYAWIRKIEKDMIFLDTTIASKEDLQFIKYIKLLQVIFCDHSLFSGHVYDKNYARDHFFKNQFETMAESLIIDKSICEFKYFEEHLSEYVIELDSVCAFIDGINPDEQRFRWDVLQIFHLTLMAFLNTYGYDFQFTDRTKIANLLNRNRVTTLLDNYWCTVQKMKMHNQKELKQVFKTAKTLSTKSAEVINSTMNTNA